VRGVAPVAGRRPRALLVGALPGFRGRRVLRRSLEVVEAGAFDAVHALEDSHPEVVVIDSAVAAGPMGAVLERLRTMDEPARPAVVMVTSPGRRLRLTPKRQAAIDDFVSGSL